MRGKAIIIKGDNTKCYDEVIFVMKKEQPDLVLADKIINKYRYELIQRTKIFFECIFYFVMLILAIIIGIKIMFIILRRNRTFSTNIRFLNIIRKPQLIYF